MTHGPQGGYNWRWYRKPSFSYRKRGLQLPYKKYPGGVTPQGDDIDHRENYWQLADMSWNLLLLEDVMREV